MKFLTFLLLFPLLSSAQNIKHNESLSDPNVFYRLMINPLLKKIPAAYVTKDSLLVVNDSLETINTLVKYTLLNSNQLGWMYKQNDSLVNEVKRLKELMDLHFDMYHNPAKIHLENKWVAPVKK